MEAIAGIGRIARSAGHDHAPRQERLPRGASAGARLGRDRDFEAAAHFFAEGRSGVRHRLQLYALELCDADAQRQAYRSCHARLDRHQQGCAGGAGCGRRRWAHPRRAPRRGEGPAARQDPRPARGGHERDPLAEGRVDGAVDAAADAEHQAALALSRDLGIAARGRCQGDDHHPRCRQPARPAVAVLGQPDAARLYRLGQDHAARLWARAGDGSQIGQAREALHQCLGRCGDRLHRHGFRDRGARADPDPVDPDEQFLDGDRIEGDAGRDREVPLDRHQRALRQLRPGAGRLWRAGHRARGDRAGDPPRHREDPRGDTRIARIHHREGGRRLALWLAVSPEHMKINDVVYSVGRSGFFNRDLAAIKAGARADGFAYPGKPVSPGFEKIVQPGTAISVMLLLDDGQVALGDCVDVILPGLPVGDALIRAEQHLPFLRTTMREILRGRPIDRFREMAEEIDGLIHKGRRLHTALRYGITQALLHAAALANRCTMAEIVSREYGCEIATAPIPILASCHKEDAQMIDRMILKRVELLPHASFQQVERDIGLEGEKLIAYAEGVVRRIREIGDPDYRPKIHLDVYGTLGELFGDDVDAVARYLDTLEAAVRPHELLLESFVIAATREAQIVAFRALRSALRGAVAGSRLSSTSGATRSTTSRPLPTPGEPITPRSRPRISAASTTRSRRCSMPARRGWAVASAAPATRPTSRRASRRRSPSPAGPTSCSPSPASAVTRP